MVLYLAYILRKSIMEHVEILGTRLKIANVGAKRQRDLKFE
jgi:hypothetical protein